MNDEYILFIQKTKIFCQRKEQTHYKGRVCSLCAASCAFVDHTFYERLLFISVDHAGRNTTDKIPMTKIPAHYGFSRLEDKIVIVIASPSFRIILMRAANHSIKMPLFHINKIASKSQQWNMFEMMSFILFRAVTFFRYSRNGLRWIFCCWSAKKTNLQHP